MQGHEHLRGKDFPLPLSLSPSLFVRKYDTIPFIEKAVMLGQNGGGKKRKWPIAANKFTTN